MEQSDLRGVGVLICEFGEENSRLLLNLNAHCQTLRDRIVYQIKTMYPRTSLSIPCSEVCFHVTCKFFQVFSSVRATYAFFYVFFISS
jgi:hypothetical protein